MDILHLNYFLAVAHHKSFTKASQALHISQPSISKSIRTLEEEWGVTLFQRHSRDIELTEVGQSLLPKISAIVSQFQELNQQMTDKRILQQGHFKLGIPPMAGTAVLSPLLSRFHEKYPHISISIDEAGSKKVAKQVIDGDLQAGIVALPISSMPKNNFIFHSEPIRVVVPAGHHLAYKNVLTLSDIKDEAFAFFNEDFTLYETIMNQFQNIGARPNLLCKSMNWDFLCEMVRSRLGIALLPASICNRLNLHDFRIIQLEPTIYWRLALIWSHDVFISSPTRLWLDYFKEVMPKIPPEELQADGVHGDVITHHN